MSRLLWISSFISVASVADVGVQAADEKWNVIVSFKEGTDIVINLPTDGMTKAEAAETVKEALEKQAKESHQPVLDLLESVQPSTGRRRLQENARVESFWVSNSIFIEGASADLIAELKAMEGVEDVTHEEMYELDEPEEIIEGDISPTVNQWGVDKIRASQVWGTYNGKGVIVGVIDTGVRGSHTILRNNYGGAWKDPYGGTSTPNDQQGHGTHVTGTIVGTNGYGVAPGAKWIACKGCNGGCSQSALLSCGQFMICPNNDCSKTPGVVNNSWGGGQGSSWYRSVVNSWLAAGIVPVFSAGNSGRSGCRTANSPGDYDNVISFGSSSSSNALSAFSSRGPTVTGLRKPDVTAPGQSVRSSHSSGDNNYAVYSGTSMAAPHGSGVIALMLEKNSDLTFNNVRSYLQGGASYSRSQLSFPSETCGGISSSSFPNNHFGYGVVDVPSTLNRVPGPPEPTPAPTPPPTPSPPADSCGLFNLKTGCKPGCVFDWSSVGSGAWKCKPLCGLYSFKTGCQSEDKCQFDFSSVYDGPWRCKPREQPKPVCGPYSLKTGCKPGCVFDWSSVGSGTWMCKAAP